MNPLLVRVAALSTGLVLATPSAPTASPTVGRGSIAQVAPSSLPTPPARFSIHGDEIILPPPAGFCPPSASAAEKLKTYAAMFEKPHAEFGAALFPCRPDARSTTTPVGVLIGFLELPQKITGRRPDILKLFSERLASAQGKMEIQSGISRAGAVVKDSIGADVAIETTPVVVDTDDYGVYVLINEGIKTNNAEREGTIIESVTIVDGYMMFYLFVAKVGSPADTAVILKTAKSETRRFVEANEALTG